MVVEALDRLSSRLIERLDHLGTAVTRTVITHMMSGYSSAGCYSSWLGKASQRS
jgi:hypothetical protein